MVSEFFIGLKVGATLSGVFDNAFRSARAAMDDLRKCSLRLSDAQKDLAGNVERTRRTYAGLDLARLEATLESLTRRHEAWQASLKRGQGLRLGMSAAGKVGELVAKCQLDVRGPAAPRAAVDAERRVESQAKSNAVAGNPLPQTPPQRPRPRGDEAASSSESGRIPVFPPIPLPLPKLGEALNMLPSAVGRGLQRSGDWLKALGRRANASIGRMGSSLASLARTGAEETAGLSRAAAQRIVPWVRTSADAFAQKGGKLGRDFFKHLGRGTKSGVAGTMVSVIDAGLDMYKTRESKVPDTEKKKEYLKTGGGAVGSISGSLIGGAIGALFKRPALGEAIGSIAGNYIGKGLGISAGRAAGDVVYGKSASKDKAEPEENKLLKLGALIGGVPLALAVMRSTGGTAKLGSALSKLSSLARAGAQGSAGLLRGIVPQTVKNKAQAVAQRVGSAVRAIPGRVDLGAAWGKLSALARTGTQGAAGLAKSALSRMAPQALKARALTAAQRVGGAAKSISGRIGLGAAFTKLSALARTGTQSVAGLAKTAVQRVAPIARAGASAIAQKGLGWGGKVLTSLRQQGKASIAGSIVTLIDAGLEMKKVSESKGITDAEKKKAYLKLGGTAVGAIGGSILGGAIGGTIGLAGGPAAIAGEIVGSTVGNYAGKAAGEWLGTKLGDALYGKDKPAPDKAKPPQAAMPKPQPPKPVPKPPAPPAKAPAAAHPQAQARAQQLLRIQQTAAKPPARPAAGTGAAKITFSPYISVGAGNGPGTKQQVQQAMQLSFAEFERMMKRYDADKQRRSYAAR
ncbi:hypothetical protein [Chromobacterium phragmitis]|uniref:Tail tape measure protein n=1 Tax=Chromobacterium phragmitis TaxID=2202141 RepID=A0ABV0IWC8_9NEIS